MLESISQIGNIGKTTNIDILQGFQANKTDKSATGEQAKSYQSKANGTQQNTSGVSNTNDEYLSEEEKSEVQELKETDRKVRQHEMAHLAAAQGIAVSGANFQYKRGPDGMNYAVGGEVSIDTSREKDPEATIDKARRIVSAAMAPADPSPQDRSVAAKARNMEASARAELAQQGLQEAKETGSGEADTQNGVSENASKEKSKSSVQQVQQEQEHPGIETYRRTQNATGTSNLYPILDMVA